MLKKVLGLDIGTNSIGWTLVNFDDDKFTEGEIIDMGVRIVSADKTVATDFSRGKAVSLNSKRRIARGIRRGNQRFKLRRQCLREILLKHGMLPDTSLTIGSFGQKKELFNYLSNTWSDTYSKNTATLEKIELYRLRAEGATNRQLSLDQFGRILLLLNQKRGFKSNRKAVSDDEKKDSKYKQQIYSNIDQLAGKTIGQYHYEKLLLDQHHRVKKMIFTRKEYMIEFDQLWETQAAFYPEILTDELRKTIKNEVIFYQRDLRSQKNLISTCELESRFYYSKEANKETGELEKKTEGIRVMPRSHPLSQEITLWQVINNVVITNNLCKGRTDLGFDRHGDRKLSGTERLKLFNELSYQNEMADKAMLKFLGLKDSEYRINFKKIKGNQLLSKLKKCFSDSNVDFKPFESYDPLKLKEGQAVKMQNFDETQALERLWHCLHSVKDEHLEMVLKQKFRFGDELIAKLIKISLSDDFASLSAKAARRLLPYLREGKMFADAKQAIYQEDPIRFYAYRTNETQTELSNRTTLLQELPVLYSGELRNPVVERIINQVINITNAIINDPTLVTLEERENKQFEIRVELARELKKNIEQRERDTKRMAENEKNNLIRAAEILKITGRKPTSKDKDRYRLWLEQGEYDPYNWDKATKKHSKIKLADVFREDLYDIDHIIPQSRYADDSLNNKVLTSRPLNQLKNKRLAFEFIEQQYGTDILNCYEKYVTDQFADFKYKAKKSNLLTDKVPEGFVSRQLKETQYITKKTVEILKGVAHHVNVTSGGITANLRRIWGVDEVLQKINMPIYQQAGQVYTETDKNGKVWHHIKNWSKRDDHRNHAVDALIVACTTPAMIKRLNDLNKQHGQKDDQLTDLLKRKATKQPFPHFFEKTLEAVENILVSHRPTNKLLTPKNNRYKVKGESRVQKTLTPRGELHKESHTTTVKQYDVIKIKSGFNQNNFDNLAHDWQKELIGQRLDTVNGDFKKAFAKYDENPITYKQGSKTLTEVTVFVNWNVLKYSIDALKKADLTTGNPKDRYILDKKWNDILARKLAVSDKVGLVTDSEGLPVFSLRLRTGFNDVVPLSKLPENQNHNLVQTRSNHILGIYEDTNGKRTGEIVSFYDAIDKKLNGFDLLEPFIGDSKLIGSVQKQDIFYIPREGESVPDLLDKKQRHLIGQRLYRVQKMSDAGVFFRKHIVTSVEDYKTIGGVKTQVNGLDKLTGALISTSNSNIKGVKVQVNNLGYITQILAIF
jgi:CRISPR-associated endonuclease Csn1